jgi:hypothetical protein
VKKEFPTLALALTTGVAVVLLIAVVAAAFGLALVVARGSRTGGGAPRPRPADHPAGSRREPPGPLGGPVREPDADEEPLDYWDDWIGGPGEKHID